MKLLLVICVRGENGSQFVFLLTDVLVFNVPFAFLIGKLEHY